MAHTEPTTPDAVAVTREPSGRSITIHCAGAPADRILLDDAHATVWSQHGFRLDRPLAAALAEALRAFAEPGPAGHSSTSARSATLDPAAAARPARHTDGGGPMSEGSGSSLAQLEALADAVRMTQAYVGLLALSDHLTCAGCVDAMTVTVAPSSHDSGLDLELWNGSPVYQWPAIVADHAVATLLERVPWRAMVALRAAGVTAISEAPGISWHVDLVALRDAGAGPAAPVRVQAPSGATTCPPHAEPELRALVALAPTGGAGPGRWPTSAGTAVAAPAGVPCRQCRS